MGEMAFLDPLDQRDPLDLRDPLEFLDPLVLPVEGPYTPGGGRVPVHKLLELRCCTLVLLEGQLITKKEVEPITCACLRTQSTAPPSHTEQDGRDTPSYLDQNMSSHYKEHKTTMSPVLCAMCLLDQL